MIGSINLSYQKVLSLIDNINNRVTSYRLVLYFLIALVWWAMVGSFFNKVPYSWSDILISTAWLVAICWLVNWAIAKFLNIPANKDSSLITALILALILSPPKDKAGFAIFAAVGAAAIASKYIITFQKSHIFNPAAVGAFIAAEVFHQYPSWWVGTQFITPVVIVGGILVMRKMKRFTMVAVFLATFGLLVIYTSSTGGEFGDLMKLELLSTQVLFFAYIMLLEPLTSPSKLSRYIPYSILVGIFYTAHKLKLTPEEALLLGGLFTFIFARNRRYEIKFIRKIKEADGIYSYAFSMPKGFKFTAGQYIELTLAQTKSDSRGNRRYLTIASSPSEPGLLFTVKQPPKASAFKRQLDKLQTGDTVLASQIAGSFVLPNDSAKKIALLAGGIGITPFRSMVKNLIDSGQQRDVALLYSANTETELSFTKLFNQAAKAGVKTGYITDGRMNEAKIKRMLPDYAQRRFYISGPYGYVNSAQVSLLKLGVKPTEIITDFFPGY